MTYTMGRHQTGRSSQNGYLHDHTKTEKEEIAERYQVRIKLPTSPCLSVNLTQPGLPSTSSFLLH
jgi:hypothetical protein